MRYAREPTRAGRRGRASSSPEPQHLDSLPVLSRMPRQGGAAGWYEKNKHIFRQPLGAYDPEKKWDKYTVWKPSSAG